MPPPECASRALVVDDAATVRLFHREILHRAGFVVDEAANGYGALEQVLVARYDLILVDVNMPHLDGITLVQRLRADPIALTCPIITISTESRALDADAALRAGANLYLVKPADIDRLRIIAAAIAATQTESVGQEAS